MPLDPIREARRQWETHGWGDAADGMAMVTSLVRVHQLVQARIDAVLRPFDLTFARFEILRLLAFSSRGELPMARVGSLLQVHPASVTSAVGRLETQGHVLRTRSEADRRVIFAAITESGRDVVERATLGLNAAVFSDPGLPAEASRRLTRLLDDYRRNAGDPVE